MCFRGVFVKEVVQVSHYAFRVQVRRYSEIGGSSFAVGTGIVGGPAGGGGLDDDYPPTENIKDDLFLARHSLTDWIWINTAR